MKANSKAACLETLKGRILSMELAPGRALDESVFSQEFQISRTPLREILHQLAGLGYVVLERNRGAIVSPMDLEVMRSFFQIAPMIYAASARLAAENATPKSVEMLRQIQARFKDAVERRSVSEMMFNNHRLHEAVGEVAGNMYLIPTLNRLLIDHTRISRTFYSPRHRQEEAQVELACKQHDELILAIERGEAARAVQLTLDHLALSRDEMERYVRPDPFKSEMFEGDPGQRKAV